MATAKIQTVKGKEWRFFAEQKILLGLDGLDNRNGDRAGIVFSREMCYTWVSKQTDKPEFGWRNNKLISLHEIYFSNRNFWVGYMATSFPTALEEETDMSLTELMTKNGMCDTSWWDNFIKYYDGVLEKSDGYVDEPETLICELAPTQTLKIEFHPGDTVYFINDKQIACTGGHYNIQVSPFKELLNSIKNRQIFLLLLPLAVIDNQDKDKATQIVSNVLQEIFDKHLCNQYAGCIVTGLMSE